MRQSAYNEYMQCRRKWWLQYVEGYEPVSHEAQRSGGKLVGTLVHTALDAYYRNEPWYPAMLALVPEGEELAWGDDVNLARIMVDGYVDWAELTGVDAGLKILGVERTLEWEGVTGKVDLIVDDPMLGGVVVLDHKTVQSLKQLPPQNDFQLLTYALMYWRSTGVRQVAVGHNMLRKVNRTAKASPPFYDRVVNHVSEELLLKHEYHLTMIQAETDTLQAVVMYGVDDPRLFPNPNSDCSWRCEFLPICSMIDEGGDYHYYLETAYEIRSHDNTQEQHSIDVPAH